MVVVEHATFLPGGVLASLHMISHTAPIASHHLISHTASTAAALAAPSFDLGGLWSLGGWKARMAVGLVSRHLARNQFEPSAVLNMTKRSKRIGSYLDSASSRSKGPL